MKQSRAPLVWGILLIVGGLVLLGQTFDVLGAFTAPVLAVLFAGGALACIVAYFNRRSDWWFLIPGWVLGGLTLVTVLDLLNVGGNIVGSIFLWSIAAAFWAVFAAERAHWWAIIPAGVMTTIGVIPVLSDWLPGTATGAVFFLGLAGTFGVLYLLRDRYGKSTSWAVFPAAACLAMAVLLGVLGPFEFAWPVVFLIVPGVFLLVNALRRRPAARDSDEPPGPDGG